jgi:hypothetical protein
MVLAGFLLLLPELEMPDRAPETPPSSHVTPVGQ